MQSKFPHARVDAAPITLPSAPAVARPSGDAAPRVLLAGPAAATASWNVGTLHPLRAATAAEAIRAIEIERPRLLVIDWDTPDLDGAAICRAAARTGAPRVLVTTQRLEQVPAALKCGCHAILLKPFAPALLVSRLGRLVRESAGPTRATGPWRSGTNRLWPGTPCPKCGVMGAISFDYSSYRRMWYACLACECVWLGPRQE